jgi:hypothetical protein
MEYTVDGVGEQYGGGRFGYHRDGRNANVVPMGVGESIALKIQLNFSTDSFIKSK